MTAQPERKRGHLSRVPPHDDHVEEHLLGAALLSRPAAEVVAGMAPEDFYRPSHATLAAIIGEMVQTDQPTDAGTVAAVLRERGQLDAIGTSQSPGAARLIEIQAKCPMTTSAPKWAEMVTRFARKRTILARAADISDAVYAHLDVAGLIAELGAAVEADADTIDSTWEQVNLQAVLAGEGAIAEPAYLCRTDGKAMLYPAKTHAFNAESESGKSWLALAACAERMAAGEHVVYIDFEASPSDITDRLLALGVEPGAICSQYHYVRPDEPVDAGSRLRMTSLVRAYAATLVVIDGMAEALSLSGLDENSASDIARFYGLLTRPIQREGAAVIVIDHLAKDRDKQGNDARGSGHKRAGIDGATFKLETVRPFARGVDGLARITVTKDRHGWVRAAAAGGRIMGDLHVRSSEGGAAVTVEIQPSAVVTADGHFRPTQLMERVCDALAQHGSAVSQRWVRENVRGKTSTVAEALRLLVAEGYVHAIDDGSTTWHSVAKRFSASSDSEDQPDVVQPEFEEF